MSGNSIGNGTPLAGPVVVPSPIGSASSTAANANMGSSDSVAGPSGSAGSSALASRVATPTPSTAQAQAQAQAQAHAGSADSSLSMLTYGVAGYVDDDDQVPVCIKHVALLAVRAFYPPDCVVMLDTILRYNQVTEEDLMKFFKLDKDKASLNKTIAVLRSNRFIKEVKIKQVKTPEQKYSKADIISYVVDYESLVNVVKYRLHKINQLLRQQTARLAETADMSMAKYKCAKCGRGSTEVDIVKAQDILQQQLHNPSIPNRDPVILHHDGRLLCYFCGGDVVPDDHAIKLSHAIGARESRFNEQIRQLVLKIKEVDKVTFYDKGYAGIQLPQAPEDAMYAKVSTADVYQAPSAAPALQWRSGRPAGGMGSLPTDNMAVQLADSSKAPLKAKAPPIWMQKSTIYVEDEPTAVQPVKRFRADDEEERESLHHDPQKYSDYLREMQERERRHHINRVLETMPDEASPMAVSALGADGDLSQSSSDTALALVGGRPYPLHEITDELIAQMSDDEYNQYYILLAEYI